MGKTLSPRQRIIATLIAAGLSDKRIAARLQIGEETVNYHVRRIIQLWQLDTSLNVRIQITHRVIDSAA